MKEFEGNKPNEYSPFHPELDKDFPSRDLKFSDQEKTLIVEGKINPVSWVSIFRSSPAGNSEAEMLMGSFVTDAVRAGQWVDTELQQDKKIDPTTQKLPDGSSVNIESFQLKYEKAAETLVETGLAKTVKHQGKTFLSPTEDLLKFVEQRIGFDRPKKKSSE